MELDQQILSDLIHFSKYAQHLPDQDRRETWDENVDRVRDMHHEYFAYRLDEATYDQLANYISEAFEGYVRERTVLPSMRSMQFAGGAVHLSPVRQYNCSYLPVDDVAAFREIMFLLLSGTGVGYSVQQRHVGRLPTIQRPTSSYRYKVADSIEGWADAIDALMQAYLGDQEWAPAFDFRDVREKGALIVTSGGRAPGPEPLANTLQKIADVLRELPEGHQLRPIEVHDICCHIADAVLAGGIRRAAMISLFDRFDEEMLHAKSGAWWEDNAQRARANNTAVLPRGEVTRERFEQLWATIEANQSGEPGFTWTDDPDMGLNPCAEVSLHAFQMCNLTTVHAGTVEDQQDLNARVRAAAIIGTLQAAYTDFHYLRPQWRWQTEAEALIGVSMTGIASGPVLDLDLDEAAQVVKETNAEVADLIGINRAARTTVVKPEGTSSLVLGTSSGIHAWHDDYYFRRVRLGKNEALYTYLAIYHPELIEDDVFDENSAVVSLPQKAPEGAITREESALDLLDRVRRFSEHWIAPGHRSGDNYNNVSTTVNLRPDEWAEAGRWMWEHRDLYTAISVLPHFDANYQQMPFESIDETTYLEAKKAIPDGVDLTKVVETVDTGHLNHTVACGSGGCAVESL